MDVLDFINRQGKKEVPNPNFKPKSKKNIQPSSIVIQDLTPDNDSAVNMAIADEVNQFSIDSKIADKYRGQGVNYNPWEDLDKQLSDKQGTLTKFGNALAQAVVSEVALGTLKGFSDLFDLIGSITGLSDDDYSNPVSRYLEEKQEEFRNFAPIHNDPNLHLSNGGLLDAGWWASNLPSVVSSLTLLIPSTGVVKGASYIGKLGKVGQRTRNFTKAITGANKRLKAAERAKEAGASIEAIEQAGKLNRVQKFLTSNSTAQQTAMFLENGMTATLSRAMENYQEARQTYNDMYAEAAEHFKDDDKFNQFVESNNEQLRQAGIDTTNKDEVAKHIATFAADRTFQLDWLNVGFDVIQMYGLRNAWKGLKNNNTNPIKVRRANIDAAKYAGKTPEEIAAIKASRKFGEKAKDWAEDRLYGSKLIVGAQLSEGVEEAVNYIASEEGMRFGRIMLGTEIGTNQGTWSNILSGFDGRLGQYLQASELWDSAFWGTMGGIIFQAGGSKLNRISNKIKESRSEANKNADENMPWYVLGDLPENKRRIDEIHARQQDLATYQEKLKQINEGKDIYNTDENGEIGTFASEEAQQAARDKLKDEFITKMTIRAMNAGNFDLLKAYMQDENLSKAFVETGMFDSTNETKSQQEKERETKEYAEDAVRRMDEIARMYDEEITAIDYASAQIGKDRGYNSALLGEYMQIIATNNVYERIGLKNLQSDLTITNNRIAELKTQFADRLDPNINHEANIRLGLLTNMLGQLRAQRNRIIKDNDSLSNRIAIQNIDKRIKSIEDSLSDAELMFATQHSLRYVLNDDGSYNQQDTNAFFAYRDAQITRRGEVAIGNIWQGEILESISDRARTVVDDSTYGEFDTLNKDATTTYTTLRTISPELDNLYKRKIATEKQIDFTKDKIARTVDEVETQASILHNTMNEARQNAIDQAGKTILNLYKKYGNNIRWAIRDDYYKDKKGYDEDLTELTESERKDLDDALKILQLTKSHNKSLADMLERQFQLQDEIAAAREVTDEDVVDDETSEENATNLQGDTDSLNPDFDNYTGMEIKATDEPQSSQNDDVSEQIDPQNIANRTPTFYGNSYVDKRGNMIIKTQKEDKGHLAFYDNGDDTFTVDVRGDVKKLNNPIFFGNTQSVDLTRPYEVVSMPIVRRDSKGNMKIVQSGELRNTDTIEYQEEQQSQIEQGEQVENVTTEIKEETNTTEQVESEATNPSTGKRGSLTEQSTEQPIVKEVEESSTVDDVLIETPSTEDDIRNEALGIFQKEYKNDHNVDLDEVAQQTIDFYVKQGFPRDIVESAVNKSKAVIQRVIERRKNNSKTTMASSIDEVIIEQNNPLEKAYKDAVDNMIAQYAKEFGLRKINGKYYINLEDLLRFVNEISQDRNRANWMFYSLKSYLETDEAKQEFVITDSNDTNNANFLSNVAKSSTERYLERIGEDNSQRVDIQSIVENLADEKAINAFYETLESLNVGDKLSYTVDNGRITIRTAEGKSIGTLPIPKINSTTGAYTMINDGWVTDVLVDNNGNIISKLKDTFRSWFDESNDAAKELNDIILEFAYTRPTEQRNKELLSAFNNNIEIKKARTNGLISSTASNEKLLNGLAKLWKYKTFNADTKVRNRNINIKASFNKWFESLAKSYDGVRALVNNEVKGITISDISQGEIIRATDVTGKPVEQAAIPITKAIVGGPNPTIHKIALVKNGIIKVSGVSSITASGFSNNSTFVLIPNHNGNYDYVQAVPSEVTDDYLGQDAKDIMLSIQSHAVDLFNEYNNEPNEENYNKVKDFILRLFEKEGMFYNVIASSNGNVLVFRNPTTGRKIALKQGSKTIDITHPEFEVDKNGYHQKSVSLESPEAYRHIKEIINSLRFNVYKAGIDSDNNTRIQLNGLASRTKDGKFQIKVGDKTWAYTSYNEFVLNNNLFRINIMPNEKGTSNYSRKGLRSQKGNQVLRINLARETRTPVESSETTTTSHVAAANVPINTQVETILSPDNKSTNKGLDIVKLIFDDNTLNIFEKLDILPKNIIFDETLNDKKGEETTNAFINIKTGNVTVGKKWLDLFKNPNTRQRAIRILIHEQLHGILHSEKGKNKGYIKSAQEIYDEFKKYLDNNKVPANAHIRVYLFNNETPEVAIEEFLVESLTNKELADYLNGIDAEVTKKSGARNLFQRILEFLSDVFGWNVREGSLYEKELHTLRSAFNEPINTIQNEEVQEKTNIEQTETETDNNEQVSEIEDLNPVDNPYGEDFIDDDFDEFESSVTEVVNNDKRDATMIASNIPSIQSMQDRLLPEQRANFASLLSSAAIQSSCK